MSSFSDKINRFVIDISNKPEKIIIDIRKKISNSIIDKTPIDTLSPGEGGQAKASWVASIGSEGKSNHNKRDRDGSNTKNSAEQVASTNIDDDYYLVSTCPYINVLEYGEYPNPPKKGTYLKASQSKDGKTGPAYHIFSEGGFSAKAPNGMVRITVVDFQNIVEDIVKGLK